MKPNCGYAPGAGFIQLFFSTLAACTEPVGLIASGVFLAHHNPLSIGIPKAVALMVVKLVLVPAVAIGCAFAVGLEGAWGRAVVILASLPISTGGFVLASRYDVAQQEVASSIGLANLLILPTTLAWVAFMDAVDLFPADPPRAGASCTAALECAQVYQKCAPAMTANGTFSVALPEPQMPKMFL